MTENKEIHYYGEIVEKLDNNLILCNNIIEIDESIIDNMTYGDYWQEDFKQQEKEGEENIQQPEIYQYFLLNCKEYQIKNLQEHYPELIYSYSELLDLFVLCVPHCGTSWDYVKTEYRE